MRAGRHFDFSPLTHPLWWAALGLLAVNDHALKGQGIVPGWLTGKLSDFAFLIVAPALVAVFMPATWRGRRVLALVVVAGVYVAADLSPAVSDAIVAALAALGRRARLWPDPTDLMALAVLPATWWLLRRRSVEPRSRRAALQPAGVILGAMACLATTTVRDPGHPRRPFLVNLTASTLDVTVTWLLVGLDCDSSREIPDPVLVVATLDRNDLDDPRAMTLTSGDVAALIGPPRGGVSAVGQCVNAGSTMRSFSCAAAIIEVAGLEPVLMVTRRSGTLKEAGEAPIGCDTDPEPSLCAPRLDPRGDPGPEALAIALYAGRVRFVPGAYIRIAPLSWAAVDARPPAPDGCRAQRDAYRASVSAAKACTTDADCQALRTPGLPGEAEVYTNTYSECFVAVNRSVAPDAQQARVESWQRACETAEVAGICPDLPAPPVSCVGGSCALAYPYGSAGDGGGPGSMDGGASAVDAAREGGGG